MQRLILKHLKTHIHFSYVQNFLYSLKGNKIVPILKARRLCVGKFVLLITRVTIQKT